MIKRLTILFLALVLCWPVFGADGAVSYVGGTVQKLTEGSVGKLDTSSQTELIFVSPAGRFAIPYASIDSYEHSQEVAHHLGVLPAIAVGLVKKRQKKHFLRVDYHDESKTPQVVVLEVPKKMPRTLLAILQERAPQGCRPQPNARCSVQTN